MILASTRVIKHKIISPSEVAIPIISANQKVRKEVGMFETSLSYMEKTYLKKSRRKNNLALCHTITTQ
jgi:hypothetical protein